MASSPLVFKVKYETRLKRFCASVVDKKLDLDLAKLKDKIHRLFFSFGYHAGSFTMTYLDEEGDEVCLDTDDELQEAVRQNLNPVRITIKLNRESRYSPLFGGMMMTASPGSFGFRGNSSSANDSPFGSSSLNSK